MTCRLVPLMLAAMLCAPASPVAAQGPDLAGASLADLMRIEIQRVFGASERLQPVTEAPSSVTIVTAEEIRRYDYQTLADIVRGARGFYTSNDRNYSYIGVRGFGRAGDYNTRVLLLVNGQRMNDNVYDQASIGAEFNLDIGMIERVEIIRGPASSLYGTSAFFAVINVVTKTGASLDGTTVTAGAGSLGTQMVRATTGQRLANGVDYAFGGAFQQSDGVRELFFPVFRELGHPDGIARGLDAERAASMHGRLAFGAFTVSGGTGVRHKDVPTASFGTIFDAHDPHSNTEDRRTHIGVEVTRAIRGTRLAASASYVHATYFGRYPFEADEGAPIEIFDDGFDGRRLTLGARATRALRGRQTVTAGVEFTDHLRQNQWETSNLPGADWRLEQSSRQGALFVQDEVAVGSRLLLSGGLRYDQYGRFERVTPRGAVIVKPTGGDVLKYLYGRAFRAPNAYELYYYTDASAHLKPESIDTHEIAWERYTGEWLRTGVSAYRYDASQLITFFATDDQPSPNAFGFENAGRVTVEGIEAEAEVRLKQGVQLFTSYGSQRGSDEFGEPLTNAPRHIWAVRGSLDTFAGGFASVESLRAHGRLTLARQTLPAATIVHVTAGMPLGRSLSAVASVRNLLDRRYSDPASDEHVMDAIEQNGRTLRAEIQWRFGK